MHLLLVRLVVLQLEDELFKFVDRVGFGGKLLLDDLVFVFQSLVLLLEVLDFTLQGLDRLLKLDLVVQSARFVVARWGSLTQRVVRRRRHSGRASSLGVRSCALDGRWVLAVVVVVFLGATLLMRGQGCDLHSL